MPYTHRISVGEKRATIRGEGAFELEETRQIVDAAIADPLYEPAFNFLVDVREADSPNMEDAKVFMAFLGSRAEELQGRIAVVVSDILHFGMARMGSIVTESQGIRMRAFQDIGKAEAWLAE